jgi:hypothetical protein
MLTGLTLAALARTGNTHKYGQFKDRVARAVDWYKKTVTPNGALSTNNKITSHIFLLFGLSEVYAVTGDPELYKIVRSAARYLESQQLNDGFFGASAPGVDVLLDTSVAAMTVYNCDQSGIIFNQRDIMYDKLLRFVAARMENGSDAVKDGTGKGIARDTADEFFHLGGLLSILKAVAPQFPTNETMNAMLRSRDLKPGPSTLSPDGWFLNTWIWQHYPINNWNIYCKELRSAVAASTTVSEPGAYSFPMPRSSLYRYIGQSGIAAFNTLTFAFTMNKLE